MLAVDAEKLLHDGYLMKMMMVVIMMMTIIMMMTHNCHIIVKRLGQDGGGGGRDLLCDMGMLRSWDGDILGGVICGCG